MSNKIYRAKKIEIAPDNHNMIPWIELGLAAALTLILVFLHFVILRHSGNLWRDEIHSLNFIKLPSIIDMWENRQHDSYPILWLLVLRAWVFMGFSGTDFSLRVLGLIVGLGTLCAIWYTTRSLSMRAPFFTLVLFAMSPMAFIGDSLRAYGLGTLLIVISLGTMWRFLQNPTPRQMIITAVSVILSVQCLYSNSFLILAICTGAAVVGFYRKDKKLTMFPLGVGMLAAVSVLPYLETFLKSSDMYASLKVPLTMSLILSKFGEAIDPSGTLLTLIWLIFWLISTIVFIWVLIKSDEDHPEENKGMALFLLSTMLLSIVAYTVFIKILSYPIRSWYCLPLIAVLIIILDKGIDIVCKKSVAGRVMRIICVLALVSFMFMDSWTAACTRKTNIDVIAGKLESVAQKDDLIVIFPFHLGISFARYYKGSAEWISLPEFKSHNIHRYDILKIIMTQKDPIKPVLQKIAGTLQSGNKVWIVGNLISLPPGKVPVQIPPAPNSIYGWSGRAYLAVWSQQTVDILQSHAMTINKINIPLSEPVFKLENAELVEVSGWRP